MPSQPNKLNLLALAVLNCIIAIASQPAFANSPLIDLFSASDLGTANSGGAAVAADASTAFTNSAAIVRFPHQEITFMAIGVDYLTRFSGRMFNPGVGPTPISEVGAASSKSLGVIPALYYILPLSPKWASSISVTVPYGLGYKFPTDSVVRYELISGRNVSEDIGLSVAYRFNPAFSIGGGPDLFYYYVQSKVASRTLPLPGTDSVNTAQASSWTPGWHIGFLYELNPQTRFGLAYHSQFITHLEGSGKFYPGSLGGGPVGPVVVSDHLMIKLPLASLTTLSMYRDINPRWAMMATLEYMNWSIYQYDHTYNVPGPLGFSDFVTPRKYYNTFSYHLGTSYKYSDTWLLRAGVMYIASASSEDNRDTALPDPANVSIGVGARYQRTKCLSFDMGYLQTFLKDVNINHTSTITGANVTGVRKGISYQLGGQVNWDFA